MFKDNYDNSTGGEAKSGQNLKTKRLSNSKSGDELEILKVDAGKGAMLNLMNLGLSKGNKIKVKRPSRLRGPVTVIFNETEIAIGFGLAEKIIVRDL